MGDGMALEDNTPIGELGLKVRTVNALYGSGAQTYGELKTMKEHELLRLPNFGRSSLADVMSVVKISQEDQPDWVKNYLRDRELQEAERTERYRISRLPESRIAFIDKVVAGLLRERLKLVGIIENVSGTRAGNAEERAECLPAKPTG